MCFAKCQVILLMKSEKKSIVAHIRKIVVCIYAIQSRSFISCARMNRSRILFFSISTCLTRPSNSFRSALSLNSLFSATCVVTCSKPCPVFEPNRLLPLRFWFRPRTHPDLSLLSKAAVSFEGSLCAFLDFFTTSIFCFFSNKIVKHCIFVCAFF